VRFCENSRSDRPSPNGSCRGSRMTAKWQRGTQSRSSWSRVRCPGHRRPDEELPAEGIAASRIRAGLIRKLVIRSRKLCAAEISQNAASYIARLQMPKQRPQKRLGKRIRTLCGASSASVGANLFERSSPPECLVSFFETTVIAREHFSAPLMHPKPDPCLQDGVDWRTCAEQPFPAIGQWCSHVPHGARIQSHDHKGWDALLPNLNASPTPLGLNCGVSVCGHLCEFAACGSGAEGKVVQMRGDAKLRRLGNDQRMGT
jgi:hypothetical protein